MSSSSHDTMIVFDHVWKKFRRGERHDSLRDLIPALTRQLFGRVPSSDLSEDEFWAVRDVSFAVRRGEALGIIGPNGAGKSTILKLLNKILRPTRGTCDARGRVGALIEVAAGFHPDLTGRENVYLQGAIMGMKQQEIASRLDNIVSFAGIEPFIDTPVKRYSSGMNARLGFSIAAHLAPDSLIIDEVLSVGDMAFQDRCVKRMKEFKRDGAAIAFVSHNLPSVADLCDRVLVLNPGRPAYLGSTTQALEFYLERHHASDSHGDAKQVARLTRAVLVDESGDGVSVASAGQRLTFLAEIQFLEQANDVSFGFVVHDSATGLKVAAANSASLGEPPRTVSAGERLKVRVSFFANLANGQYLIEFHAATAATMTMHVYAMPAAVLRVEETVSPFGLAYLAFTRPSVTTSIDHGLATPPSCDSSALVRAERQQ